MRVRNLFLVVPVLLVADCGGRSSLDSLMMGNGGAVATGAASGTGCTGSFEIIQSGSGLCVATMVTISAPSGFSDYSIDVTEVTMGQYDDWLARNPALPASTDATCGYVMSYTEQSSIYGIPCTNYAGADADHHPVGCVDWCDAYNYCLGVDKRLCGAIGGGSVDPSSGSDDATLSQWYRACSSGGANKYPYGNTVQPTYCNGAEQWSNAYLGLGQSMVVGTLPNCQTSTAGYAGAYDLVGNVEEWEDSCSSTGHFGDCLRRGGSFDTVSGGLDCGSVGQSYRNQTYADIGFRCCSQ